MNKQEYKALVSNKTPKSPILKDCFFAFIFGGGICSFGEALKQLFLMNNMSEKNASLGVSATIIVITAVLTGAGAFDKIAKLAGAGTAVPISGFANAVVSPAIEFKAEGMILGVGAKMFAIAGPVIVYGVVSAMLYGVAYYISSAL